jgi:hypothetical protein
LTANVTVNVALGVSDAAGQRRGGAGPSGAYQPVRPSRATLTANVTVNVALGVRAPVGPPRVPSAACANMCSYEVE